MTRDFYVLLSKAIPFDSIFDHLMQMSGSLQSFIAYYQYNEIPPPLLFKIYIALQTFSTLVYLQIRISFTYW